MNNIRILDCTLRDGGYVNDFNFGRGNIRRIISCLQDAEVDIVECGFLEDCTYDPEASVYNRAEQISEMLPQNRSSKTMFVAMACYGEYDLAQLSHCDGNSVTGIRVTFHYNEVDPALDYCRKIKELGYKVFVQPVGTTSYSDEQLLHLIKRVNELSPYSFYLVDTLGLMLRRDVARFFYLIDNNLNQGINMGFHSHNNLQLSFSNCQYLCELDTERIISVDSSVFGMGRGAGNLNTELIANYLNQSRHAHYRIEPILAIVDEQINPIKEQFAWGYSPQYYLAAINGCHPNYASYLASKNTLTIREVSKILKTINPEDRSLFNKSLAETKYLEFQSKEIDDSDSISVLTKSLHGKQILIIGPGPSIRDNSQRITEMIDSGAIAISVGFIPDFCTPAYVFISNQRRYKTSFNQEYTEIGLLHTSNIVTDCKNALAFNYSSLLDEDSLISDNSMVMLLNLLSKVHPGEVLLAGFDGYRESGNNFYMPNLETSDTRDSVSAINCAMSIRLKQIGIQLTLTFITPSLYTERYE